jgi:hypothetical protein
MMNNAGEHHAKAEQLLEQAHAEQDSIRRHLILAEAQVHATLALSAPADEPPSPGQTQVGSTASTGEADPVVPAGSDEFQMLPHVPLWATSQPTWRDDPTGTVRSRVPGKRPPPPASPPVRDPALERPGDTALSPSVEEDLLRRLQLENQRPEQEPDPAQEQEPGQPGPGGPGEEEPGDLDDQKPRGPEERKPGGFTL